MQLLISAFLSCSQGTAGSEKPDVSQPIRFLELFRFFFFLTKTKIASAFAFAFFRSLCDRKRFFLLHLECSNSQSYKNTIGLLLR